ncbi:MAG: hypothetical protein ACO3O3_10220 [Ilumatobacteraceae bacterium]
MRDYFTYALVAGAALFLAGPQILDFLRMLFPANLFRPKSPKGISFTSALTSLAAVRQRLVDTDSLPKDAAAAIEVLTHAIMSGSDK